MTDMTNTQNFSIMPKAELHAHLNGSIPPHVTTMLIAHHGVTIPEGFVLPQDLTITSATSSLLDYFRPWNILKRLPVGQECLCEMVDSAVRALAEDNVVYTELRNSPYNIAEINGISLTESLHWLIESFQRISEETPVDARLIISFSRYRFDMDRAKDLLDAIEAVNSSRIIVGIDLSGNENDAVPLAVSSLFRRAKDDLGLGVTIHAGECGDPANVEWAVTDCNADRIGHALAAVRNPRILDLLREKNTCVEVCLTSNVLTGSVPDLDQHPVLTFITHEIPFVLCTDNPAIHQRSLTGEYELFAKLTGRHDMLDEMLSRQLSYSFGARNNQDE